jgi:hypothetical protein
MNGHTFNLSSTLLQFLLIWVKLSEKSRLKLACDQDRQALPSVFVDHRQHPKDPTIMGAGGPLSSTNGRSVMVSDGMVCSI